MTIKDNSKNARHNIGKLQNVFSEYTGTNVQSGGKIKWPDGEYVIIHESANRIGLEIHGKTIYDFYYYKEGKFEEEDHPSDVIQFRVLPEGQQDWTGWLMNVEDTVRICSYLLKAAKFAMDDGHSPGPLFDMKYEEMNNEDGWVICPDGCMRRGEQLENYRKTHS